MSVCSTGNTIGTRTVRVAFRSALAFLLALIVLAAAPPQEAQAAPGDVLLASRNAAGTCADDDSSSADISADGRYVAFQSWSTNLTSDNTNATSQVYRKDLLTGEVVMCSAKGDGTPADAWSGAPSISADGRYVAFQSNAINLASGLSGSDQVFRKDLQTGKVVLCSANADGNAGDGGSSLPDMTPDGRYVVFWGDSANLVAGKTTSGNQVFRKDLETKEVALCSADANGDEGNNISRDPSISDGGRYVAYESSATDLIAGETTSGSQIFRKDLQTGEVALCSADADGNEGTGSCGHPSISASGDFVAFSSYSPDLVSPATSGQQVFRKNLNTDGILLCSANAAGEEAESNASGPSISADGRFVAFYSSAQNLVPGGTFDWEVFRKDLKTKEVALASSNAAREEGDAGSAAPSMTPDGRFVAFESHADNLVTTPVSKEQVFRKELEAPTTFFFAEGYTGSGFHTFLCLGQPANAPLDVTVTFMFKGGGTQTEVYTVPPQSRLTTEVNGVVGEGQDVSMMCQAESPFIAERPMYFDYTGTGGHWTGGHDTVGAGAPSVTWYFAEGYTGLGFDEWICVLNPSGSPADLTFRFQTQHAGEKVVTGKTVPAHSRETFNANQLLSGIFETSLKLESSVPVVAERPMYFNYTGVGVNSWTGGHCVMGASSLASEYFFAEGYTGPGFEQWLCIQNPNQDPITVDADYQLGRGQGGPVERSYEVPARGRETVYVPSVDRGVGPGVDVSVRLSCSEPFLAERPMYFDYSGMGGHSWPGGHCVIGATERAEVWFFAEGYTGDNFEEWLCIQNPGATDAQVTITYYPEGGTPIEKPPLTVPANTRSTVYVNGPAGAGPNLSISAKVEASKPVIVERPMYFNFGGAWPGGHDVLGYVP